MSSEDSFTADFSLTKPAAPVTLDDYHRMLDNVDERLVGRGPVSDRPSDLTDEALWFVTDSANEDEQNSLTRYDADQGEWLIVGGKVEGDVGDETDPVSAVWAESIHAATDLESEGLATLPFIGGANIDTGSDEEWYKIGTVDGTGASCKVLITETSRNGNTHETGIEFASFNNGNAEGEHGGFWYQMSPDGDRIQEGDFGLVETGTLVMDIYYKAGPYTRASAIALEGNGFTPDFQNVGTTEPTDIVYLDEKFPIASPVELANGFLSGFDVDGNVSATGEVSGDTVSGTTIDGTEMYDGGNRAMRADGYEIVVDNEEPDTDRYIRFETEGS